MARSSTIANGSSPPGRADLANASTAEKTSCWVEASRNRHGLRIALLERIETAFPTMTRMVVFADQAAYRRAAAVEHWLVRPGRRVELRFVLVYCPHFNPAERLWGETHRNVTHNTSYATKRDFACAILTVLRDTVPKHFDRFMDRIADNFRIVKQADFQVLA